MLASLAVRNVVAMETGIGAGKLHAAPKPSGRPSSNCHALPAAIVLQVEQLDMAPFRALRWQRRRLVDASAAADGALQQLGTQQLVSVRVQEEPGVAPAQGQRLVPGPGA